MNHEPNVAAIPSPQKAEPGHSTVSPRLNRERILSALADSLNQKEIDRVARETMMLNPQVPAEVIGILAILGFLRQSRLEDVDESEDRGDIGEEEQDDAERYGRCLSVITEEWE